MKLIYGDITLQPGANKGGIASILFTPKENLVVDPVIDFNTGVVSTPVVLSAGMGWYEIIFTPYSYSFEENPKSNREGSFYELAIKGTVNNLTASTQQVLATLRYSELIVQCIDREKNIKIAGNTVRGMLLQFGTVNTNTPAGSKSMPVTLTFQSEDPAPFYAI